jgi:hypothetical protein
VEIQNQTWPTKLDQQKENFLMAGKSDLIVAEIQKGGRSENHARNKPNIHIYD